MHRIHPTHLGARGASLLLALFILTPVLAQAEEQRGLQSTPPSLRLLDTPWQDEEDESRLEPQQPSTQVRLSTELGLGLLAGAAAGAGDELSFQSETRHKESTRPRVTARPILAVSAHGVLLGMGGSF